VESLDLAESGLRVSCVGLGGNNFGGRIGASETRAVVEAALEAGIAFFDTAETYGNDGGSERLLGEILEGRRDQVVLATKFGWRASEGHGTAKYVEAAIAGSLERLRTDYVDLYYLHKPDPGTPIGETLDALHELVRAGTVRAIGCSNFSAEQVAEADRVARERGTTRFTVLQNHYNLLRRDDDADVLPLCRELGVSYVPYFPLASGLLTGKYRRREPAPEGTRLAEREIDDEQFDRIEPLARFAGERGHTLHELAIAALLSTPGIAAVIPGATTPEQARANAAAAGWRLSAEELGALRAIQSSGA
jgi:aryl-alcohol dehydrogenase-like predicted oxidoreductase